MADRSGRWLRTATDVLVLAFVWAILASYFKPSLLLLDTMDAGGDTPSFLRPVHHLRDVLLPAGHPQGWDLANFAGYAPYQYYFLPPSLAIVGLSTLMPLNVAFKLVTVVGVFALPLCTALATRWLGFGFPLPAVAAAASLLFLFNEGNSMWGANIPSTLAGEFSFSIGFALAVLFLGLLYRNVERQRGWRSLAVLLALTGLCHPVAFLNAAAMGLYFLFDRRHFVRNLRFLLIAYGGAVLLMAFWLVPLIAKLGYATSINWKWHFDSWRDLMPTMLAPVAVLAALDALWVLLRRRPEDRPARYLLLGVLMSAIFFVNGTELGLPEIRFVPFVYLLLILLALDFLRRAVPVEAARWPDASPARYAPHVGAAALTLACAAWAQANTSYIPSWIRGNYEGIERKAAYPLLRALGEELEGSIQDPRVAYENSTLHERFGSMRVFESMALLTGRATLEGVLLQTAVNSPFIYWIQAQISKQGTHVIPGYRYPSLDPARATPRLELFNAHDVIAVSDESKGGFAQDERWERVFSRPPYEIFHLKGGNPRYVEVPRYQPVLLDAQDWKQDFHLWFAEDDLLDVPLVAAHSVPAGERERFRLRSGSPLDLPREPIQADCRIEERMDHLAIEFTTSCPGLPHWISVSYFPNWHAEGAGHVFLASPGFMLVFPEGPRVRLEFRRRLADWLGIAMSLIGLGLCLVPGLASDLGRVPGGWLPAALGRAQPVLVTAGVVGLLSVTAWHGTRDWGSTYLYQQGWAAFEKNDYARSERLFTRAMWLGGDSTTAGDAAFFRATSLLRAGDPAAALQGYQRVIDHHPTSIWVAESHYHVGLCLRQLDRPREAEEKFRFVIRTYPGNRWAGFAENQLAELAAQRPPPSEDADG